MAEGPDISLRDRDRRSRLSSGAAAQSRAREGLQSPKLGLSITLHIDGTNGVF